MEYREEHQISPEAPLAPGGGEAACTTLLPSRRRDEEQGGGLVQVLVALVLEHTGTSPTSV